MSMAAAPTTTDEDFAHAAVGSIVKLVVELRAPSSDRELHGVLLEKQSEKVYKRTASKVIAHSESDTKIIMGKSDDIHPSAVVHITGKLNADRSVAASQIVILTGYVDVQ